MRVFVDTSVWYAAADEGDRSNERARAILSTGEQLLTTDHVLVESWMLLRHRLHIQAADRFVDGILDGAAEVETVGIADLRIAREIRLAFPDQDFSLVDLTSFSVMQRLGVSRAAAFDADFAVFRYGPRRARAFTMVV